MFCFINTHDRKHEKNHYSVSDSQRKQELGDV